MVDSYYTTLGPHGKRYYYGEKNLHVGVVDFADSLSKLSRFCGSTKSFYSVAEHSIFVKSIVQSWGGTKEEQRVALMHDAHEAVTSDIPTPFQRWVVSVNGGEDHLKRAKDILDESIYEMFELDDSVSTHKIVKDADYVAFFWEASTLLPIVPDYVYDKQGHWFNLYKEILSRRGDFDTTIVRDEPAKICDLFVDTYNSLLTGKML